MQPQQTGEGFRFSLGERVTIAKSRHSGRVEGRAEFLSGRKGYYVRLDLRIAGRETHWYDDSDVIEEQ
ncbi:hypothetical protein SAMN05880590_10167 [Rhizobium sp. RU35A]|uniref:hypothetical protein n=1 Tax=Rhizobium sp. RU35A TaxID=1907414 RepID=UPI0009540889|nr:hypothetical protein [Rhizobium sp. RU35A]SIP89715.1 hypothetical protein SAMN05880590_10167 [Rhizobium sp. RU35A]